MCFPKLRKKVGYFVLTVFGFINLHGNSQQNWTKKIINLRKIPGCGLILVKMKFEMLFHLTSCICCVKLFQTFDCQCNVQLIWNSSFSNQNKNINYLVLTCHLANISVIKSKSSVKFETRVIRQDKSLLLTA